MKGFDEFIHSNFFEVHFAGFRATGADLQRNGWKFSAYQNFSSRGREIELQLMLQHDGGGMSIVTQINMIDIHSFFTGGYGSVNRTNRMPTFEACGVRVGESNFIMERPRNRDFDFSERNFSAIDAAPRYERINLSTIDFSKFGVFQKLNDISNIFLPEKTVNELMEEILSKQAPKQAEIRASRKREEGRQEWQRNPNEDIKLQLVAV